MNPKQKLKIGIAGFSQESVTFWPGVTDLSDFEENALYGQDVIEKLRNTNTPIGGFIDICEHESIDLYPICAAPGDATAPAADEAYNHYVPRIVEGFNKVRDTLGGIVTHVAGMVAGRVWQKAIAVSVRNHIHEETLDDYKTELNK